MRSLPKTRSNHRGMSGPAKLYTVKRFLVKDHSMVVIFTQTDTRYSGGCLLSRPFNHAGITKSLDVDTVSVIHSSLCYNIHATHERF